MPGVMESVSTFNSLIRTLLALTVVGAVGAGGWVGYQKFSSSDADLKEKEQELNEARLALSKKDRVVKEQLQQLAEKDAHIGDLKIDLQAKELKIQKLDTAMRLLKVDHRVARLRVIDQEVDPETSQLISYVEFVELDDSGQEIDDPKQFPIKGDVIYIDNWVVKFEDEYIEKADLDRSTSLVLFRRIFGEAQKPVDGYQLDQVGTRPKAYGRGAKMTEFERQIWSDFWAIANDEERARELGIRAAHGEAPSMKVEKGKSYRVELRASDGLSIRVDNDSAPPRNGRAG